jgi:hypothetical protein
MNLFKCYTYFCFITYPVAITFLALSKFQERYDTEFLISGLILAVMDTLGITLYVCNRNDQIQEK